MLQHGERYDQNKPFPFANRRTISSLGLDANFVFELAFGPFSLGRIAQHNPPFARDKEAGYSFG
jgi:hypothetical protein